MRKNTSRRFQLSRKNQKGQVAIFVALIFQVIFVFFALLINVGLLVHHKINLQHSADMAAYYGAMKQGEILNAMAHVNYQIRQAWKLFTWRYRIYGTFGMRNNTATGPDRIVYPIEWSDNNTNNNKLLRYNTSSTSYRCTNPAKVAGITFLDVPFMCMAHNGFADWLANSANSENFCKVDCPDIDGAETTIPRINNTGSFSYGSANVGGSINAAINAANGVVEDRCKASGPTSVLNLALYYSNYVEDTANRKKFIKLLFENLKLPEDKMLDLNGDKILSGVNKTFLNNLTEANKTSVEKNASFFATYNSVKNINEKDFFNEITFQVLKFYVLQCIYDNGSITKLSEVISGNNLGSQLFSQISATASPAAAQEILNIFLNNNEKVNTIGYEKNPWVQVYYGVRATAEPKIPFLPLGRIKLHAVSFAKPFGGSLGPKYGKTWPASAQESDKGGERVDPNLPSRVLNTVDYSQIKQTIDLMPNYSFYLNDVQRFKTIPGISIQKNGLADPEIAAFYYSMLLSRTNLGGNSTSSVDSSKGKDPNGSPGTRRYNKPRSGGWPSYNSHYHFKTKPNEAGYDPVTYLPVGPSQVSNSYLRDIELSVVAPNLFDVTYYSIDPNFYDNVVKKMEDKSTLDKLVSATGAEKPAMPYDFGYNKILADRSEIPKNFSVMHQLEIVRRIFKENKNEILKLDTTPSIPENMYFKFTPTLPQALLTSWTFNDFRDFVKFPNEDNFDNRKFKMSFGTCQDVDGDNPDLYKSKTELSGAANLPATQGNCVTGGRTGYSVKMIAPKLVMGTTNFEGLGGAGTSGPLKNPVDAGFLRFPN